MKNYDLKLLFLFLLIAGTIVLRVAIKPDGYLSPDSKYYLQIAQNVLDNKGLIMSQPKVPEGQTEVQIPVTIWPAGYPLLIAGISLLTGLTVFWASKLLNILLLAGLFMLIRLINKEKAWLLGLYFCSHAMLQLFSYSWSEVPFLFFELLFVISLHKLLKSTNKKWWIWLFVATVALFLCRYIGLFVIPILGVAGLWRWYKKDREKALGFLVTAFVAGCIVLAYFYRNYLLHGTLTGEDRVFTKPEPIQHFLWVLFHGVSNEFALFLHHYRKINNGPAFYILAVLQVIWLGWLYQKYLRGRGILKIADFDDRSKILLLIAVVYLVTLIVLRLSMPFDSFNLRLLAPFSLPFYLALFHFLFNPIQEKITRPLEKHLLIFFLFSLLVNVGQLFVRYLL